MTTVEFGDFTRKTDLGRLMDSAMRLLGWGTLAVPTGIVTAELISKGANFKQLHRRCALKLHLKGL